MAESRMLDYDFKVLRCIRGDHDPDLHWGAAMSESLEFLRSKGFVKMVAGRATLTEAGDQFLKRAES